MFALCTVTWLWGRYASESAVLIIIVIMVIMIIIMTVCYRNSLQQYIVHIRLNYRATYNRKIICTKIDNKSQSYFKNH